jgi:hypothetical protein
MWPVFSVQPIHSNAVSAELGKGETMKRQTKESVELTQRLRKSQDVARNAIAGIEHAIMVFTSLAKTDTIQQWEGANFIVESTRDHLTERLAEYVATLEQVTCG